MIKYNQQDKVYKLIKRYFSEKKNAMFDHKGQSWKLIDRRDGNS